MKTWFSILVILLILTGCNSRSLFKVLSEAESPTSANTPDEMFAALIGHLIPVKEVKDLQGTGDTWQGYAVWLRFIAANDNFMKSLIQDGYHEIKCDSANFRLPNHNYDLFKNPAWGYLKIDQGKCFFKNEIKNVWTYFGSHYFYVNLKNNLVYFYGTGG